MSIVTARPSSAFSQCAKIHICSIAQHFAYAQPFMNVTTLTGIDPETGHPIADPAKDPSKGGVDVRPAFLGGPNFMPLSYNPAAGLVRIPVM